MTEEHSGLVADDVHLLVADLLRKLNLAFEQHIEIAKRISFRHKLIAWTEPHLGPLFDEPELLIR